MSAAACSKLAPEQLRRVAFSAFRVPFHAKSHTRNAARHLATPLWGPVLKSYWPLRLKDYTEYGSPLFSSLIPLSGADVVVRDLHASNRRLPLPLRAVYRTTISEWRRNRGQQTLRKGESKQFSANLGNFAFSKSSAK